MTREEAIDIIKKYDIHGCGYCHQGGNEVKEAFNMAIKALEQEPKTGHWKFVQRGKYINICCCNCGYQRVKEYAYNYTVDQISEQDIKDFFSNSNMNFCENCGVKMVESEDKE